MGCYGIGTTRLMQAVVEQCNDEGGIIWPASIAPYSYHIIVTQPEAMQAMATAEQVVALLGERDCMLDDRHKVSAGVKFNDADLIGAPYKVVVGRKAGAGIVDVSRRGGAERMEVKSEEIADVMRQLKAESQAG